MGVFSDAELQRGVQYAKFKLASEKYLQVFTLHSQCTNFSQPAEYVPMIRDIRDQSVLELVAFIKTKIDEKFLTILAGDFNILRYPINPFYLGSLFGRSPDFIHHISIIEGEYEDLLRTLRGSFSVEDCWVRDN